MEYQMVTWPITSRDPERSNYSDPITLRELEHNISKAPGDAYNL